MCWNQNVSSTASHLCSSLPPSLTFLIYHYLFPSLPPVLTWGPRHAPSPIALFPQFFYLSLLHHILPSLSSYLTISFLHCLYPSLFPSSSTTLFLASFHHYSHASLPPSFSPHLHRLLPPSLPNCLPSSSPPSLISLLTHKACFKVSSGLVDRSKKISDALTTLLFTMTFTS